jgi:hypothetical protein
MSARILDEDGRVLYPDPKHVPDPDALQDLGTVAYPDDIRASARAGRRPLVVRAMAIDRSRDNVIVPNSVAERIWRENSRGRFLERWAVCVLVAHHYPGYD